MFNFIFAEELAILKHRKESTKWAGSTYESVKDSDTTIKGDFGEAVMSRCLSSLGIEADIVDKGKGDFDILLAETVKLENKLATEDSKEKYQFNGIKVDINYDFVTLVAVAPEEIYFDIVIKGDFYRKRDVKAGVLFGRSFVPMTRDGDDTYKLHVNKKDLIPFTEENLLQKLTDLNIINGKTANKLANELIKQGIIDKQD
jgi:hypothetical protein